jgi:hypothetical protein
MMNTLRRNPVFQWYRRFKEGLEHVQDDPRSGEPKTQSTVANVDRVQTQGRDSSYGSVELQA